MDSTPQIAVVALSGGMDSTSLLLHLLARNCEVHALSFHYGQKHALEIEYLKRNLAYLRGQGLTIDWRFIDLSSIAGLLHSALVNDDWQVPEGHYEQENMKATFVPNRNAIFASIGYSWALSLAEQRQQAVSVGLGVHAGDHAIYPDCRPEFYQALLGAFQLGNWGSERVGWYVPYLNADKYQILCDAQESTRTLGLDFEKLFANTLTSYAPDSTGRSTGLTGSDVERILAFDRLGIPDPLPYHAPWDKVVAQAKALESEFRGD